MKVIIDIYVFILSCIYLHFLINTNGLSYLMKVIIDIYVFILSCLGLLVLFIPRNTYIIWLSNILILRIPDEGYSGGKLCTLGLISRF